MKSPDKAHKPVARLAVYAGSFDPATLGHIDLIERASALFSDVIVAIGVHPTKAPLFSAQERSKLLAQCTKHLSNVRAMFFSGLLIDFCREHKARVIVRGLRAVTDFEYELQMANMNRHLEPTIETMFLMANDAYFYVSSNLVKEAARLGGDVTRLVPDSVASRLTKKLGR